MSFTGKPNDFQELTPLICGKCGSAVPLSDLESAPCIYCGAEVGIPEQYHRGQQAKARLESIVTTPQVFCNALASAPASLN